MLAVSDGDATVARASVLGLCWSGHVRLLLVWLAVSVVHAAGWEPLFDGKTLAGWRVCGQPEDQDKVFWQARDGVIACDSLGRPGHNYVWLVRDGEFSDFELRLQVRGFAASPGNSGVQVRSRWDEQARWMNGPQVDVHPPAPFRTGLLYDETRETRRWIFPSLPDSKIDPAQAPRGGPWNASGWNVLRILCEGTRIRTWLNGTPVSDFDGEGLLNDAAHRSHRAGMSGQIALQLHNRDELKIEYRDVQVRRLR